MQAQVYWIDGPWRGRLGILPRPLGGDLLLDEIDSWREAGVDVAASLLTPEEVIEFDLANEAKACGEHGIEFLSFPIPDLGVPATRQDAVNFAEQLCEFLAAGQNVVIHCRGGIGRSGLMAASLLILAGANAKDAIRKVSRARGCAIPETTEQEKWLRDFSGPAV